MNIDRARALPALLFALVAVQFALPAAAAEPPRKAAVVDHSDWDGLLRRYVSSSPDGINRVDYVRWKSAGIPPLEAYIARLEKADPSALPRNQQMAFWINLYNAKTVAIVLARYPVSSIKEIDLKDADGKPADGPWKAKVTTIAGSTLSLDDIENQILRPKYKDPRVHYALNCLSLGCPNLLAEAYTGAKLKQQLDGAARSFVNHPRGISFVGGKVQASSIYDWFADDFGGFDGVVRHMKSYAGVALGKQLAGLRKIDAYDYDWKLNDLQR